MNPTNGGFAERLRHVIAGRKIDPWARKLRIPAGTRARMLKGQGVPPTHETLARLMRVENCSISWLLGASTPPYLVARTIDDLDTAEQLQQHLGDSSGWQTHLLMADGLQAWVLHQPATLDRDGEPIDYTAVRVIAGPSGPRTSGVIIREGGGLVGGAQTISGDFMRRVYGGEMGTFQLFGDGATPGLIGRQTMEPVHVDRIAPMASAQERVAEQPSSTYGRARIARELAEIWPILQDNERAAINTLLDPFLDQVAARRRGDDN